MMGGRQYEQADQSCFDNTLAPTTAEVVTCPDGYDLLYQHGEWTTCDNSLFQNYACTADTPCTQQECADICSTYPTDICSHFFHQDIDGTCFMYRGCDVTQFPNNLIDGDTCERLIEDTCPDGYSALYLLGESTTCDNSEKIGKVCNPNSNPCTEEECATLCSADSTCTHFFHNTNNGCFTYTGCSSTRSPGTDGITCEQTIASELRMAKSVKTAVETDDVSTSPIEFVLDALAIIGLASTLYVIKVSCFKSHGEYVDISQATDKC